MWPYKAVTLTVVFAILSATTSIRVTDVSVLSLANEIDIWAKLGRTSETFKEFVKALVLPSDLHHDDWRSFTGERSLAICTVCRSVLKTFIGLRRGGMSEESIRSKIIKLCVLLNLQTEKVCEGAITLHLPSFLYIIDHNPDITAFTACGVLLESKSCPLYDEKYIKWSVQIDDGPAKQISSRNETGTMNIVQITDIHYDPNYEVDGNSFCAEPTCCRKGQNDTNKSGKLAGFWGDYNYCDTPWHAVVDALDHINTTHKDISYVYCTGDIIDHGVWETSKAANIESINKSYTKIYQTFHNIPVYPIVGNHEPHPVNVFPPRSITDESLSIQWLYEILADIWIGFGWLPKSTRTTLLQGGFYTVSPTKGFRIIAVNNNVCYCYNWWMLHDPQDPDGQLQWLHDTLLQAEKDGEFVHILAHIPANHKQCQSAWKREYLKIVARFAHIITGQFNGHSHNDELQLFYGDNHIMPNNIAWNGGSITTYTNLNPNYKVYIVDKSNFAVKDYENWMYNLTLANQNAEQRPYWYKSYSFKEEYNLSDVSFNSLSNWLKTLATNENLLNRYIDNFFKNTDIALRPSCDRKCQKSYVCGIIAHATEAETLCKNVLKV